MPIQINNVPRRVVYAPTGAGGVGPYAFTFEILAAGDIAVFKDDTLLTITTHYTVTIASNGTGTVTITAGGLAVAPASPTQYAIVGNRTIARVTDYVTGGDFFANTLNDELDQQTIFAQQNAEGLQRALIAPQTDPTTIDMILPGKTSRAGKYLSFNTSTGNPEVVNTVVDVTTVAGIAANVTTVAGISANVTNVAGNATNINTVAGISGNVTTVAGVAANVTTVAGNTTNINTVATNLSGTNTIGTVAGIAANVPTVAGIAANVTTVAGIAANVTTVAGISANVTSVAGNASNINQVAADTVAINAASTNAANAAASQAAAAASQAAAAAAAASAGAAEIVFAFDNSGIVISSGNKGAIEIPFACTINSFTLLADQSGSIVVDLKKSTFANFPTTSSITGSATPALSSSQKVQSSTLTGWTTTLAAKDILEFVVTGTPTSVTLVTMSINVTRT